ncbi:MAG: low specificity L-threonine aldolase, partial [Rubrobacter sp.]|nr:low specificity L-threonine aldolase [Rubrobacter sp.]
QAGIIASASLYAFEHHVERLTEDHDRARKLADCLREAGYAIAAPETNIVLIESDEPARLIEALERAGVLATLGTMPAGGRPGAVRLCTHLDVADILRTDKGIQKVVDAFKMASSAAIA